MFSIIIPTILKKGMKEAVESALNQTYSNYEIILIGDGVMPPMYESEKVRTLMRPRCGNQSATRMTGVAAAKEPWIVFLDDDDWVVPWYLESFIPHLSSEIVISQMENYGDIIPHGEEIVHGSVGISFAAHKTILNARPLPDPPSEDYVFLKREQDLGTKIAYTNRCGYFVRKYGK